MMDEQPAPTGEDNVPQRRGKPWDAAEDRRLYDGFTAGASIEDCAAAHGRSNPGIRGRLRKLGLLDEDDAPVTPVPDYTPAAAQTEAPTPPDRHGLAWSLDEEKRLYDAYAAGAAIRKIADDHQRTPGGIRSTLQKLGLLDRDGAAVEPRPEFTPSAAALKRQRKAELAAQNRKALQKEADSAPPPEMNPHFREALRLMEETDRNLFITGKAGTGKSTLLSWFCRTTGKQPVVLAPTGVAALNVRGQTIHKFFNFYVDVTPEKILRKKDRPRRAKLYKKLRTLIIDEVSMVRADLLDCVDVFLRRFGPDAARPFGGVQMIFVGDLHQLPPVVAPQEKEYFAAHYQTPYFFSAHALAGGGLTTVTLEKIYRQKEQEFVDLLNRIRNNSVDEDDIARINSRLTPATGADEGGFAITLATTNAIADAVNESHLDALAGKLYHATARIEGQFGREYYPTLEHLTWKIGAQIMLLNNDAAGRWVNGSIGVITDVREDEDGDRYLAVKLQDNRTTVEVYPHPWEVYRFGLEDGAIRPEPAGSFTQYPFRLAWAITIHKSQGKTFQRVVLDVGRGAFAAGQIYVALSRCTSFEGLTLKTPLRAQDIRTDPRIFAFLDESRDCAPLSALPVQETIALIRQAISDQARLALLYRKADDTETACNVVPLHVGRAAYQGAGYDGMKAFCTLHQKELMFRIDRILKIGRAEG